MMTLRVMMMMTMVMPATKKIGDGGVGCYIEDGDDKDDNDDRRRIMTMTTNDV